MARANAALALHRLLDEAVKALRPAFIHDALHGGAKRTLVRIRLGENLAPGALQQFAPSATRRHFEARRDIGLERKQMQQPFAKGVDRLDF